MTRRRAGRLGAGLLAGLLLSCSAPRSGNASPVVPAPRVVVQTERRDLEVAVEIARTDEQKARGLMFRERLGPDQGMLFVFERDEPRVFWMKNTLIPLDMIFIDGLGRVVSLVERAEPLTEAPRRGAPSTYVLEVAGGWAGEHGVHIGDRVALQGLTPR